MNDLSGLNWNEPWKHPSSVVSMCDIHINGVRQYCGTGCYSEAAKAGRKVRMTDVSDYPICSQCESRVRNGLVKYQPSNGTEMMMFEEQCERCRHHTDDGESPPKLTVPGKACMWAIKDKLIQGMWSPVDSAVLWFDPLDLDTDDCPATCRRFTGKGDADGEFRDPPPPDCIGQLFFGDVDVPVERVPVMMEAR